MLDNIIDILLFWKKPRPDGGGGDDKEKKGQARETVEAIGIAIILALIIRTFCLQAFKIPSSSMEDTLLIGDHLLVSKFSYGLQVPRPAMIKILGVRVPFFQTTLVNLWGEVNRGDIIVFRWPEDRDKDFIKRVVAVGGDTISIRHNVILINGKELKIPQAVFKGSLNSQMNKKSYFSPFKVPEGEVFVMGDNRDNSFDSRFWGTVPMRDIKGRALILYWSWDYENGGLRGSRILNIIR